MASSRQHSCSVQLQNNLIAILKLSSLSLNCPPLHYKPRQFLIIPRQIRDADPRKFYEAWWWLYSNRNPFGWSITAQTPGAFHYMHPGPTVLGSKSWLLQTYVPWGSPAVTIRPPMFQQPNPFARPVAVGPVAAPLPAPAQPAQEEPVGGLCNMHAQPCTLPMGFGLGACTHAWRIMQNLSLHPVGAALEP